MALNRCRMCAGIPEPGVSLLDPSQQKLAKWTSQHLKTDISPDNGYPTYICLQCIGCIREWVRFKDGCNKSYQYFTRKISSQVKNESIKTSEVKLENVNNPLYKKFNLQAVTVCIPKLPPTVTSNVSPTGSVSLKVSPSETDPLKVQLVKTITSKVSVTSLPRLRSKPCPKSKKVLRSSVAADEIVTHACLGTKTSIDESTATCSNLSLDTIAKPKPCPKSKAIQRVSNSDVLEETVARQRKVRVTSSELYVLEIEKTLEEMDEFNSSQFCIVNNDSDTENTDEIAATTTDCNESLENAQVNTPDLNASLENVQTNTLKTTIENGTKADQVSKSQQIEVAIINPQLKKTSTRNLEEPKQSPAKHQNSKPPETSRTLRSRIVKFSETSEIELSQLDISNVRVTRSFDAKQASAPIATKKSAIQTRSKGRTQSNQTEQEISTHIQEVPSQVPSVPSQVSAVPTQVSEVPSQLSTVPCPDTPTAVAMPTTCVPNLPFPLPPFLSKNQPFAVVPITEGGKTSYIISPLVGMFPVPGFPTTQSALMTSPNHQQLNANMTTETLESTMPTVVSTHSEEPQVAMVNSEQEARCPTPVAPSEEPRVAEGPQATMATPERCPSVEILVTPSEEPIHEQGETQQFEGESRSQSPADVAALSDSDHEVALPLVGDRADISGLTPQAMRHLGLTFEGYIPPKGTKIKLPSTSVNTNSVSLSSAKSSPMPSNTTHRNPVKNVPIIKPLENFVLNSRPSVNVPPLSPTSDSSSSGPSSPDQVREKSSRTAAKNAQVRISQYVEESDGFDDPDDPDCVLSSDEEVVNLSATGERRKETVTDLQQSTSLQQSDIQESASVMQSGTLQLSQQSAVSQQDSHEPQTRQIKKSSLQETGTSKQQDKSSDRVVDRLVEALNTIFYPTCSPSVSPVKSTINNNNNNLTPNQSVVVQSSSKTTETSTESSPGKLPEELASFVLDNEVVVNTYSHNNNGILKLPVENNNFGGTLQSHTCEFSKMSENVLNALTKNSNEISQLSEGASVTEISAKFVEILPGSQETTNYQILENLDKNSEIVPKPLSTTETCANSRLPTSSENHLKISMTEHLLEKNPQQSIDTDTTLAGMELEKSQNSNVAAEAVLENTQISNFDVLENSSESEKSEIEMTSECTKTVCPDSEYTFKESENNMSETTPILDLQESNEPLSSNNTENFNTHRKISANDITVEDLNLIDTVSQTFKEPSTPKKTPRITNLDESLDDEVLLSLSLPRNLPERPDSSLPELPEINPEKFISGRKSTNLDDDAILNFSLPRDYTEICNSDTPDLPEMDHDIFNDTKESSASDPDLEMDPLEKPNLVCSKCNKVFKENKDFVNHYALHSFAAVHVRTKKKKANKIKKQRGRPSKVKKNKSLKLRKPRTRLTTKEQMIFCFNCEICQKGFRVKNSLEKHILRHLRVPKSKLNKSIDLPGVRVTRNSNKIYSYVCRHTKTYSKQKLNKSVNVGGNTKPDIEKCTDKNKNVAINKNEQSVTIGEEHQDLNNLIEPTNQGEQNLAAQTSKKDDTPTSRDINKTTTAKENAQELNQTPDNLTESTNQEVAISIENVQIENVTPSNKVVCKTTTEGEENIQELDKTTENLSDSTNKLAQNVETAISYESMIKAAKNLTISTSEQNVATDVSNVNDKSVSETVTEIKFGNEQSLTLEESSQNLTKVEQNAQPKPSEEFKQNLSVTRRTRNSSFQFYSSLKNVKQTVSTVACSLCQVQLTDNQINDHVCKKQKTRRSSRQSPKKLNCQEENPTCKKATAQNDNLNIEVTKNLAKNTVTPKKLETKKQELGNDLDKEKSKRQLFNDKETTKTISPNKQGASSHKNKDSPPKPEQTPKRNQSPKRVVKVVTPEKDLKTAKKTRTTTKNKESSDSIETQKQAPKKSHSPDKTSDLSENITNPGKKLKRKKNEDTNVTPAKKGFTVSSDLTEVTGRLRVRKSPDKVEAVQKKRKHEDVSELCAICNRSIPNSKLDKHPCFLLPKKKVSAAKKSKK